MKPYIYVIGDVHGEFTLFEKALKEYDPTIHQLVLIGDLNDRGPKSKQCLLKGMELAKSGAIYLRGNHEEYLLEFLAAPEDVYPMYLMNGGKETIESLLHPGAAEEYSPTEMALMIRSQYKELVEFLLAQPIFYEWQEYIFVHAGVDLTKSDWHETAPHDFIWIREPFHNGKNNTGKKIVFGHTITPMLYGDMVTSDLWIQDNKIGIDGGAVYGGKLHGVIFNQSGILQDISFPNPHFWQPSF